MNGLDEAPLTVGSTSPLPFELQRLGVIMEPEAGNPYEVEGVLNPAAVRGPDGELYLFPRLAATTRVSVLSGFSSTRTVTRLRSSDLGSRWSRQPRMSCERMAVDVRIPVSRSLSR